MFGFGRKALGRDDSTQVATYHAVLNTQLKGPFPKQMETVLFGMGCFWGAERIFWQANGVYSTSVGYSGGAVQNANYKEVCSGQTGHAEVVQVVYDPEEISFAELLKLFWESHDPTQGSRQGNDVGTQYRSTIYTSTPEQNKEAHDSQKAYQEQLDAAGLGKITTEVMPADKYYYAEDYHQQYLHKNPDGYCGIGGTGVSCPIGLVAPQTADE